MTTSQPLNLLDLPNDVLFIIYNLFIENTTATVEVPARKCISNHYIRRITNSAYHLWKSHRFVFRDANGSELQFELLGVNRQLREHFMAYAAATIPLELQIISFAPSIRPAPHLIAPAGWSENVQNLTVSRYIGMNASLHSLLAPFTNLGKLTVDYDRFCTLPCLSVLRGSRCYSAHDLSALHGQINEHVVQTVFAPRLRRALEQVRGWLPPIGERGFRIQVRALFGEFTSRGHHADGRARREEVARVVGVAVEVEDEVVELRFEGEKLDWGVYPGRRTRVEKIAQEVSRLTGNV